LCADALVKRECLQPKDFVTLTVLPFEHISLLLNLDVGLYSNRLTYTSIFPVDE